MIANLNFNECIMSKVLYSCFVPCSSRSIYLGLRDAALETVFRTDEGFTAPWAKWRSTEPNDPTNSVVEHCVIRNIDTHWVDVPCHYSYIYYCEGNREQPN